MKIVAQSTTSTRLPYFHLAYLAANNGAARVHGGFVASGGLIFFLGFIIFSKWVKEGYTSVYNVMPSLSFKRRLAIGASMLVIGAMLFVYGLTTRKVEYYPSAYINRMGNAFKHYAQANNGKLPDPENWCDCLISDDYVRPNDFHFDGGDVLFGENAFALNENVAGKVLSEIPGDTVLLFETDLGHKEGSRKANITCRSFIKEYKKHPLYGDADYLATLTISEKRWNQCGGEEILTTRYNDGEGCDVLFADGRAEFVPNAELASLKWQLE